MEFGADQVLQAKDAAGNLKPNVYVYVDPARYQLPGYSYVRKDDYDPNNAYEQPGSSAAKRVYWKAQSYQIVSPGFDGKFGNGTTSSSNVDDADNDNITNFSDGMLNG